MTHTSTPHRPGPLGALIDETHTAAARFAAVLEGLDGEALDLVRATGPGLCTVRAVVEHVLLSAHRYANFQRKAFGMPEEAWKRPPKSVDALRQRVLEIPEQAWELLRDRSHWTNNDLYNVKLSSPWGQQFDLETLLEHALVHLLRHRRQIAAWLERDGDLGSVSPAAAGAADLMTGKGTVTGEAASAYLATAEWYDRLYRFKDYEGEAGKLVGMVTQRHPGARTLLDVACGTGRHLEFLRQHFECAGLDNSAGQLAEARRQLPGLELHLGDMRHFRLERRFDVITCLFSAIGYMTTPEDLALACRTMAEHLNPGGLLVIEPWIAPENWKPGTVHALFIDEPALKLARINTSETRGRCSVFDMHHLVGTPAGVQHLVEHHELLLATREELRSALEAASLTVEYDEPGLSGRGLWIAQRV